MIVHRFMSEDEFLSLRKGETLRNKSKHEGYLTTSVGFCFFVEPPDEAIHWLSGCCDPDYCVTMDIDSAHLKSAIGHYRNPMGGKMDKVEYCCTSYSLDIANILSYTDKYRIYSEYRRILRKFGLVR